MLRFLPLGAIISTNVFLYINHTQGLHIRAELYSTLSVPFLFKSIVWKHSSDLET